MSEQHDLIYVRGLGNPAQDRYQKRAIGLWRLYGLNIHYFSIGWGDKEPWTHKEQRLLSTIDTITAKTGRLTLVGTSAGASAVLNAFSKRLDIVNSVVCISGKVANIDTRTPNRRLQENPAYKQSLDQLEASLEQLDHRHRQRILTVKPLYDRVVPVGDMHIEGARELTVPMISHVGGIAAAVTIGSPWIMHFIKQQHLYSSS